MSVYYVPFSRRDETLDAVKAGEEIFSLNWKANDSDVFRQKFFEFPSGCGKSEIMAFENLFAAQFENVTFNAAFFKFRDDVKNFQFN